MLLTEYLSRIVKIIEEYSKANLIISSELNNDFRTEQLGLIKGIVIFADESILFFTEYLDLKDRVEKLTYSFHYQTQSGALIFRYDNARHKPKLSFENHKHLIDEKIIEAPPPELAEVLEVTMDYLL
jgi:hypothetical protein